MSSLFNEVPLETLLQTHLTWGPINAWVFLNPIKLMLAIKIDIITIKVIQELDLQ